MLMKNRHYAALLGVLSLPLAATLACSSVGNQNTTVAVAPTQLAPTTAPTAAPPTVAPAPPPTDTPVPPSPQPSPSKTGDQVPDSGRGSPTPEPVADRFAVAGLTEKQATDFLAELQAAVAQDNHGQVADLVAFPLDINVGGAQVTIPSKQEFIDSYDQIITPDVKAAILGQAAAGLFVNDRGVMIGNGQVWFGGVGSAPPYQVRIIAVNNETALPSAGKTEPVRLSFAPGGTSASVEGSIEAGGINDYVINAMAGQMMMVSVMSPNMNVFLTVYGADGQPLIRAASGDTDLSAVLPATQDYIIEVVSGGQASDYSLQVVIPARIKFAPGATSASVQGTIGGGAIVRYLLRAMAGQTMTVVITSPHQDVLLTIWGLTDGQPLVRSVSGATNWTGVLPATQDYVIDAVSVGGNTTYTLETTVK
jgi:hypothetical protein